MNFVIVFILFAVGAYILQAFLAIIQIKHFNRIYRELRDQGKVAIGRRPGKFRAGTLALFAIEDDGKILDMRLMQGVTVLSKFKRKEEYIGHDLHYIDHYHPLVQKENKLAQEAMEDARDVFVQVTTGNYKEEPAQSPFQQLGTQLNISKNMIKEKIKGSV